MDVLIEKPITLNLDDADELIDLAEENDLIVQVGHIERFNPAIIELKNFIIGKKNINHWIRQPNTITVSFIHTVKLKNMFYRINKFVLTFIFELEIQPDVCKFYLRGYCDILSDNIKELHYLAKRQDKELYSKLRKGSICFGYEYCQEYAKIEGIDQEFPIKAQILD